MGFGAVLLVGAAIGIGVAASKSGKKDTVTFEEPASDPIPLPPISIPPAAPATLPRNYQGKYSLSVEVNNGNTGGFNPRSFLGKLKHAVETGNLAVIKSLVVGLNKDKLRMAHNQFLEVSKGKLSLYQFIRKSHLPFAGKVLGINILTNAGVGKRIVKNRADL